MVAVPPSTGLTGAVLTPPAPVLPAAVAIPTQVIAAEAQIEALKQNVLLPVLAIDTQLPEGQSGVLLNLQTPQGQVQITLPQLLSASTPQQQAQIQAALGNLKNVQVQVQPSLTANAPGVQVQQQTAHLIVPTQDWQQVLRSLQNILPAQAAAAEALPLTTSLRVPALQLPPQIAAAYGAPPLPGTVATPTPAIAIPAAPVGNTPSPAMPTAPTAAQQTPTQPSAAIPAPQNVTLILQPAATLTANVAASPSAQLPAYLALQTQQAPTQAAPNNTPVAGTLVTITAPHTNQPGPPSANLLLQTDDGRTFMVPEAATRGVALKVGDRLAITVQPEGQIANTANTIDARHPALADTMAALGASLPALAQTLDAQLVLKPALPMQGTLLFLMSAIGSFSGAANPAIASRARAVELTEAISRAAGGKLTPALASRLLAEFNTLLGGAASTTDNQGYAWHTAPLPTLMQQGMTAPFTLYIQQRQDEGSQHQNNTPGSTSEARKTRFVVDLHLSRLGHTQLEGLSRARSTDGQQGQLDLALRTESPLPVPLQNELTARYSEIIAAAGLSGTLAFNRGSYLTFRTPTFASSI